MLSKLKSQSKASLPVHVAFKCQHCRGEYATERAYRCHRYHRGSIGTPCHESSSQCSVTFTSRPGLYTGILQEQQCYIPGKLTMYIPAIGVMNRNISSNFQFCTKTMWNNGNNGNNREYSGILGADYSDYSRLFPIIPRNNRE